MHLLQCSFWQLWLFDCNIFHVVSYKTGWACYTCHLKDHLHFSILSHLLAELWSDYFICLAIGVISGANSLIVVFDYFFFKAVCFGFRVNFICASSAMKPCIQLHKRKSTHSFQFFQMVNSEDVFKQYVFQWRLSCRRFIFFNAWEDKPTASPYG